MALSIRKADPATRPCGMLVVGVFEGALSAAAKRVDAATRGAIAAVRGSGDFAGGWLETALLYPKGVKAKRVLLVGLGAAREFGPARALEAAALGAKRA